MGISLGTGSVRGYQDAASFTQSRAVNSKCQIISLSDDVSTSYVETHWNDIGNNLNRNIIWSLPHKYLITNKGKEKSFKVLHKFDHTNFYFKRLKGDIDVNRTLYGLSIESVFLLYYLI